MLCSMDDGSPLDDWDWLNDDTNRLYIEPSTRWSREKTRYLFKTNFLTPYKICLLALIDAYCDQGNEDFEVPLLYFLIDRLSVCVSHLNDEYVIQVQRLILKT